MRKTGRYEARTLAFEVKLTTHENRLCGHATWKKPLSEWQHAERRIPQQEIAEELKVSADRQQA
jgi:hypothetical protein